MNLAATSNRLSSYKLFRRSTLGIAIACLLTNNVVAGNLTNALNKIKNAPANSWVQMNTNQFSDAWVPYDLRADRSSWSDPSRILVAWSSFAWDSNRGDLIIFGGGHANYAGNELYRWRSSTQKWENIALPSAVELDTLTAPETVANWGNSMYFPSAGIKAPVSGAMFAPESSHTYDNNLFLPIADRFVTFGGATYQSGSAFQMLNADGSTSRTGPYFFNPNLVTGVNQNALVGGPSGSGVDPTSLNATADPLSVGGNMWANRNIWVNTALWANATNQALAFDVPAADALAYFQPGSITGTTDYAFINNKETVFVSGLNPGGSAHQLGSLTIGNYNNPSLDTWQILGRDYNFSGGQGAGAYDTANNIYIKTLGDPNEGIPTQYVFTFWDLNPALVGPLNPNVLVTPVSQPSDFQSLGQLGLEYDHLRNRHLLWGGGSQVFSLTVGDKSGNGWVVSDLSPASNLGGNATTEPSFNDVCGANGTMQAGTYAYTTASGLPSYYNVCGINDNFGTGVLGKWHYARNLDVFVALDTGNVEGSVGNVWFYKPAGWVLPGDLNNDGKINSQDQIVIIQSLGKSTGMNGFNVKADYDYDGAVTLRDYQLWTMYNTNYN